MPVIITDKNYPISKYWLFKNISLVPRTVSFFLLLVFFLPALVIGANLWIIGLALFLSIFPVMVDILVIRLLKLSRFHFMLDESSITFGQGIISKNKLIVPYKDIHNINISQDLFDKFFKLSAITIEIGSRDPIWGGMDMDGRIWTGSYYPTYGRGLLGILIGLRAKLKRWELTEEALGFDGGNRVHIPALKKEDAEKLEGIIYREKN